MPAILVHALNNGMSVVAGIVRYAATDKAADSVTVGMYVFWLLVGAAATIYLLVKKQLYTPKTQVAPNPEAPTFGQCMRVFWHPGYDRILYSAGGIDHLFHSKAVIL